MYVYSSCGTPIHKIDGSTIHIERCVGICSDYALPRLKKKKYIQKKNAPFTEKWQNDFYFFARDFGFEPDVIVDIIYSVTKMSKQNDTNEALYIRAFNKMLDIL